MGRDERKEMPEIGDTGVVFDQVAKEVRGKWADQTALKAAQALMTEHLPAIKAADGIVKVHRMVCGGCLDFKVIAVCAVDKHGAWEAAGYPEMMALKEALGKIEGITQVEDQTIT